MSENAPKFRFNVGGRIITSEESPVLVLRAPVQSSDEARGLLIKISPETIQHENMCYTTCLDTLRLIIGHKTIRSSSLASAKLNDKMEQQRAGVEQFANGRYITCFSHMSHEIVPFWVNYGGDNRAKKVLLIFRNCASDFTKYIYTDYCYVAEGKKLFFYSDEYTRTVNTNGICGQSRGLSPINLDYDIRNYIRSIEMFDVEYLPVDHSAFTENYSGEIDIDLSVLCNGEGPSVAAGVTAYSVECLGRQKTNPWDYEKESRILTCLDNQSADIWSHIDLRLKDEFFRGLVIVMSPWGEEGLCGEIEDIITSSSLPDDIKSSIKVIVSGVKGTLNL